MGARRFDEIISDIPHKNKCVDDTLQWDSREAMEGTGGGSLTFLIDVAKLV